MLIVLPPSETKAWGGPGAPMDVDKLSFSCLTEARLAIAHDLARLDDATAQATLGLSDKLMEEAAANRELFTSPTMPALERYTGVLYDALDPATLENCDNLVVCSALFGLVRATDMIPHYRLSGSTKLPTEEGHTPTMKARWGSRITEALTEADNFIIDLRSGTYQQLGRVKGAVTVRVEKDGKVVSHFNKHYRGLVARELAGKDCASIGEVADMLRDVGMTIEQRTATELCLIVE